ncbi:SDR family oxidoreductase [Sphingomonas sp. BIUV-7]|uniref:SDR family oxidoreductase n=1 Tax=Sphingomonas natans TaxID=3063330 RepID=A0ABT8Y8D3_9SPHN|nr:SDR family oxidoreductase [Sphingomonas sp. BIUV-7]MDO6414596.1 SDR family oxidoreductase [Sphingomonas sp. BIUV-7]
MVPDLEGRKIVVTGAGNGIGLAAARRLVALGASVALIDRDRAALDAVAVAPGMAKIVCDISVAEEVERAAKEAESALGGVDGLVNAAGVLVQGSLDELSLDQWARSLKVNLLGAVLMCKFLAESLKRAGFATIVNVASVGALRPAKGVSAYSAAKAGLLMFSKCMAVELAPTIRVNAVCPGTIETAMTHGLLADPAIRERLAGGNALGRLGAADEIADVIAYLSGPASSYVNGATVVVDGGSTWL